MPRMLIKSVRKSTAMRMTAATAGKLLALAASILSVHLGAAADPNSRDERMEALKAASRLHYELSSKNYDEALAAMALAEDIDLIEESTGMTALCLASKDASADAIDMVEPLVLKYGADIDIPDSKGFLPLHHAASAGNYAVVRFLVDHGADVNAVNVVMEESGGRITPLMMAHQMGRTRITSFLELRGAKKMDPEIREAMEAGRALIDALGALRRMPRDGNPQQALREQIDIMAQKLQAQDPSGNMEAWGHLNEWLERAVEQTSFEEGMSRGDYLRQLRDNLGKASIGQAP